MLQLFYKCKIISEQQLKNIRIILSLYNAQSLKCHSTNPQKILGKSNTLMQQFKRIFDLLC